jgi:Arc/MetJ-type ribon-helix-helix transcriptional regulator
MEVHLSNPKLEQFIQNEVDAGRFSSACAAVEAAIELLMEDALLDDDDTVAAINRAQEQIDRGEGTDFNTFAADFRERHGM